MAKSKQRLGEHTEMLPVELTPVELLERGQRLGDKHEELGKHLEKAALERARLKGMEDEIQAEIDQLAHMLRTRCEPREVRVEAWANYVANRFQAVRTDTGKVIAERPLKEEEKQGQLDDDWGRQLHLVLEKERREDIAKKRAGDVEKEGDDV